MAIMDGGIGKIDERGARDGQIAPMEAAQAYFRTATQPRSAWTFQLELRPYKENW